MSVNILFLFTTITFSTSGLAQSVTSTNKGVSHRINLEIKTFQNKDDTKGWGYDIYNEGRLYIHQPHIPAVPGNNGFRSQQNAEKAGNFAVYKIRHNIMPPTISVHELDSLKVK
ncbi:MAG TPA: DUF4907 domain-containing protein [Ferruginibacter sp.]|nr:DUF4907 domain-containing protein [Ferruginibacter sp.]